MKIVQNARNSAQITSKKQVTSIACCWRLTRGERGGNVRGMFDQATADAIADGIADGVTMRELCVRHRIGYRTVFRWADENPAFAATIARARDLGADAIADDVIDIADNGNPDDTNRARLRAETRLKLLAKWNPKKYGDKLQVDQDLRMQVEIIDCTRAITAEAVLQSQQPLPALASTSIQPTDSET